MNNGVILQAFQWYLPSDKSLWTFLSRSARDISAAGFSAVWIPPPTKGQAGINDVGYGAYDLYDLGEFDQKGTISTKYGSKDELVECIKMLQAANVDVYADWVLNHRCGGDKIEDVTAVAANKSDRNIISPESFPAKAWTSFHFSPRAGKYSTFIWNAQHFVATDTLVGVNNPDQVFLINGKTFSGEVSFEQGNFDFLMGCDVDFYNAESKADILHWANWFMKTTGIRGVRLDAVKHYPLSFSLELIKTIQPEASEERPFVVAEYWHPEVSVLTAYIEATEGRASVFDVPLHFNLVSASLGGNTFDLRTIFDGSLVQVSPILAVTFVDNHDTEPGQSLQSWVDLWFKPIAHALILLRKDGYPCVYHADYYGAKNDSYSIEPMKPLIDKLLKARHSLGHGEQHDHFDHPNCIAWVRTGDADHQGKMVVIISNGDAGQKRIMSHLPNTEFVDVVGGTPTSIMTDEAGNAEFTCPAGSLAVWVDKTSARIF